MNANALNAVTDA